MNGVFEMVSIPSSDEDYSLTLTNITFQDAGIYFCTVTSLELQGLDRSLNGFNVELLVNQRHSESLSNTIIDYTVYYLRSACIALNWDCPTIFPFALKNNKLLLNVSHK